jgi:hypothetical protein
MFKKIALSLLVGTFAAGLVACGQQGEKAKQGEKAAPAKNQTAEQQQYGYSPKKAEQSHKEKMEQHRKAMKEANNSGLMAKLKDNKKEAKKQESGDSDNEA